MREPKPLAENVPYVGGPMDGKSCRILYCESESVCMADATHHYRLVRVEGSGAATLVYAGSISTKEAANMSETNERSVASDGSVAERPLGDLNPMDDDQLDAIIQGLERIKELEAEVARLRPTDAEATAIRLGEFAYRGLRITDNGKRVDVWATLRGWLERTKPLSGCGQSGDTGSE